MFSGKDASEDEDLTVPTELLDARCVTGGPMTSSQRKRKPRADVAPHTCTQADDTTVLFVEDAEGSYYYYYFLHVTECAFKNVLMSYANALYKEGMTRR